MSRQKTSIHRDCTHPPTPYEDLKCRARQDPEWWEEYRRKQNERARIRKANPEYRERANAARNTPDKKAQRKEYRQRPEVQARKRQTARERYRKNPEKFIARQKELRKNPRPPKQTDWWAPIAYRTAHLRCGRFYGVYVRDVRCWKCRGPAEHWAYDLTDPTELIDPRRGCRYSRFPEFYMPMCRSCHHTWDWQNRRLHIKHDAKGRIMAWDYTVEDPTLPPQFEGVDPKYINPRYL
ncbi:hypothetical protein [Tsukamurella tyrosinosolvens]|uniref:hypothetical protein n=1 Tax=Tsukamurella tyrosinosolvens TaxID=57704 RepID=UPI002DD4463D|nr:hypothetical protein [Tsukamurella tyrosinosolvens]MEC4611818.1 hypothetical protein [Tsukamurella tyrosinosolvens]